MRRRVLSSILSLLVILTVTGSFRGAGQAAQTPTATASTQASFINRYCAGCHNDRTKTAGLSLTAIDTNDPATHPEVWEKVIRKLISREMPPVSAPHPDNAAYEAFTTYLETSLDRAAAAQPQPGRTGTFHRLNRIEYRNAVRDLLAFDVEDIDSLLPKDEESYGFDNVNAQALPPALMERYIAAAQKISERAVGVISRQGPAIVELPADLTQEQELTDMPIGTRGGLTYRHTFPMDAEYEIDIRLARDRDEHIEGLKEPHELELSIDGERLKLVTVAPHPRTAENAYDEPADEGSYTFRVPVKAGPHDVVVTFLAKPQTLSEQDRQPFLASFNIYRHPRMQPAIYRVAIAGPFNPTGPGDTPSRRRILICHPATPDGEEGCAYNILSTLIERAYRRPSKPADVQPLLAFYKDGHKSGSFDDGIQNALAALLVSPEFLFRVEKAPAGIAPHTAYRIRNLELASRLSFFLWSSIPDDELLNAAADGTLSQPAVLEKQVRRMLADPRSNSLITSFAEQWLQLRNLAAVNPSPRLFPDFDDNLRQAFRRETELFFGSVVHEDRDVLELLRANYTYLNERLAKHYSIPNVYGSRFRRVTLPPDSPRGGLLGQGSFLAVTSYATRTAPTLRGKWVLENILGSPPPPPPPNFPPLKDATTGDKVLTMRERMATHRDNPACASCHQIMDPVGFALENFDAVGRWRTKEEGTPIDASGALPGGAKIEGVAALKAALSSHPEPFLITMTEKLMTYALGRGVEYYDEPAIRRIVSGAAKQDYRFSSIVIGIVNSVPFQMRESQ